MSYVLDPSRDHNLAFFNRINQTFDLPHFVKTATINDTIDETELEKLPSAAFADSARRQFPCHTKAATYLSYVYYLHGANKMTKAAAAIIADGLQRNIDHWGIRYECEQAKSVFEKQSTSDTVQLPDDCFAIVERYGEQTVRKLPIISEETVKRAAEYLFNNRDKYPYKWRKSAAARILKKATQFNAAVDGVHSEYLHKCAGCGFNTALHVAEAVRDRLILLNANPDKEAIRPVQVAMAKLAKAVLENGIDKNSMTKVASFIANIDETLQLTKLYSRGLPTPEEIVCSFTEKTASDLKSNFVQLTTGSAFRRVDIEKAAFEPFKTIGDDLVSEVTGPLGNFDLEKAAAILVTLPRNDALLYEKAMKLLDIPNEVQLCKSASLPNSVADWGADEWKTYLEMCGYKTGKNFTL